MELGTKSKVKILPPFITDRWVIFTSGNIAAGKDQAGMMIQNDLWYRFGLTSIEIDPDGQFPEGWDTTSNPMDHFASNRERTRKLFLFALDNPVPGRVIIFQSGGATLDGEFGRRTMVEEALKRGYRVLHLLLDTPADVCRDRNERRRLAGKRYTPQEEFDRCVENVTKNFELLSPDRFGDGSNFPKGELYNTGMRLRYINVKKYQIVRHTGRVVTVYYHWDRATDDPYLTRWNYIKEFWTYLERKFKKPHK
jgi:hypothetical protein